MVTGLFTFKGDPELIDLFHFVECATDLFARLMQSS